MIRNSARFARARLFLACRLCESLIVKILARMSSRWKYGALAGALGAAGALTWLLTSDYADHSHHASTIRKPSDAADYFQNKKGLYIYTRSVIPPEPEAVIFLIHGMGEHSGRASYLHLQQKFFELNFAVFTMDHQGHGRSNGTRAHVEHYNDFLDDIEQMVQIALARYEIAGKNLPAFIFGHSMGGGLTVGTLLRNNIPNLKGAILSAPAVNLHRDENYSELVKMIGRQISYYLPKVEVVPAKGPHGRLSHNKQACDDFANDPLNFHGGIKSGIGNQLVLLSEDIDGKLPEITVPLLIFHGTEDKLVHISASRVLYNSVGSKEKELKIYDGLLHELFEDSVRDDAVDMILDFVKNKK